MGCAICIEWPALPSSYANRHWHFPHTAHPTWPPLCSGPENHQTLATIKSLKRCHNPPWDGELTGITATLCNTHPRRSCRHLRGLTVRCSLWKATAFIFCPFIIPVYFSPLLHSSIRPFISPSISSYSLCSTRGSICHGLCDVCAFIYRHLIPASHFFFKLLKTHNFGGTE